MSTCSFIKAGEARLQARNLTLLYTEICAIQQAILAAIQAGQYQVIFGNNSPMTAINDILSVTVTAGGTGYFPVVATADAIDDNIGAGAVLEVEVVGSTIAAITVVNGGADYNPLTTEIQINHPLGFGFAAAVTVVGGAITAITVVEGGAAYGPVLPTATIVDDTGVGATLEVAVDVDTGLVTTITVTAGGYGYSENALVAIQAAPTSAGADATATATVNYSMYGLTSPNYYAVVSGQSSDRVITDQLQFVQDYFTALGYSIRPQVNPITGNTLRWLVIW